ncbi:PTS sugar transporter subunit IIA [Croceibacterium ferulae]|uniref:PTS sugar transporter subunit IIA n=1 Tax=Croceibacterium ferulae TaxID=1854641 RepID=UPI000EAEF4A9|nr:PTS sugar transporter subunit IIA [Croceibacterium ferulae]
MTPHFTLAPDAISVATLADKPAVLQALAAQFAQGWGLDSEVVLDALEEREQLGSTGFGRGVAMPHSRIPGIPRPVVAVIRLRQPIDFAAADGLPVSLVFGLLSPTNSGATHLHALAALSRLVRDEKVHDALLDAPDAEVLYGLLTNAVDRDAA